jgi:hypothetical protein
MQCLILAGGLGTRMRGISGDLPKALLPLGEGARQTTFIDLQLKWLKRLGVTDVVLALGYRSDVIETHIEHHQTSKEYPQVNYAYDGDELFMQEPISVGLEGTPTPRGTFKVYTMIPSRYMQGPIPEVSDQYYDLPGVPWNLYFTKDGAVIHGAYWHDHFGQPWSHGCVNLPPQKAKELYLWADIGTTVTVQN